jgi:DNA polymerase III alpha subunit
MGIHLPLYNRGETIGLFQMESGGMTSTAKQFDVRKIDDIIALDRALSTRADGSDWRLHQA